MDQVFVAMSFDARFDDRFAHVIVPAVEEQPIGGYSLKAFRVDSSKSGDSILTEIANGIAHSRLILADLSVIDEGRYNGEPVRNANVMYEVGLALACRTPAEVLLIRDDTKKFLFDVSSIPHLTIDFTDPENAAVVIRQALADRLSEARGLNDARIQMAAKSLTQHEIRILRSMMDLDSNQARSFVHPSLNIPSNPDEQGLWRLLQRGCIQSVGIGEAGGVFYSLTPFGRVLIEAANAVLVQLPLAGTSQ